MSRIANVNIPSDKPVFISLTYIFGIGVPTARHICASLGIDINKRVKNLSDAELQALRSTIEQNYRVEGDLRRDVMMNIKKKKDIRCYQGLRHMRNLPVRGQNTHSNARTRKGKKKIAVAGKKKPNMK